MAFYTFLALVAFIGLSAAAPKAISDESKVLIADPADMVNAVSGERIVGGTVTNVNQYPTIVQVDFLRGGAWGQSCGGNILTNGAILCAAHCTHSAFDPWFTGPQVRRIRAGANNRNTGGTIVNVQSILNHPSFSTSTFNADICILRLSGFLTFGNTIRQVVIAHSTYNLPDNLAVIHAGWGAIGTNQAASNTLLHVTVNIFNQNTCASRYGASGATVNNNMVCTWASGRDACQGDSGGPLYHATTSPVSSVLVGVVSWGFNCADSWFPGVSARVSSFTTWISANA